MITVYRPFLDNLTCPLEHQSRVPYAPPVVVAALLKSLPLNISSPAASSILAPVQLVNCSRPVPSSSPSGPLLLFSHGYGGTHHVYASTLQAAASSSTNSSDGSSPGYSPNSTSASSTTPLLAVMYGHSFGGSTAANVAASGPRVLAAANIDGPFYGPVANGTMRKPLLMMASAPQDVATDWPAFYPAHVRGWKTWLRPNDTVHYSYTDLPLLADLLGLRGGVIPRDLTGTMDGRRLQEIVWRYTLQFFAYVLSGATPDLLDEPSVEFPDVEFVGHAEAETGQ